jgi:hypothetical protein
MPAKRISRAPRKKKARRAPIYSNLPKSSLGVDFTKLPLVEQVNQMAIDIINCLACVGNKPSTHEELSIPYVKMHPKRKSYGSKVKDCIQQWKTDSQDHGVEGISHEGGRREVCGYVCEEMGYHIVCKAKSGVGKERVCWIDEEYRPIFISGETILPDRNAAFEARRLYQKIKKEKHDSVELDNEDATAVDAVDAVDAANNNAVNNNSDVKLDHISSSLSLPSLPSPPLTECDSGYFTSPEQQIEISNSLVVPWKPWSLEELFADVLPEEDVTMQGKQGLELDFWNSLCNDGFVPRVDSQVDNSYSYELQNVEGETMQINYDYDFELDIEPQNMGDIDLDLWN